MGKELGAILLVISPAHDVEQLSVIFNN